MQVNHKEITVLRCIAIALSCLLFVIVFAADLRAADKLPRVKLSVKPLDLSRQVTVEDLVAAGQLGGQLYPTHEMADKKKEKEIHNSFGEAIQEWNKHEYKKAIKLFRQHIEKYPDSPWAAEAVLHIGCDAHYTGQYSVAESSFNWIREKFKGKDHEGAKKLVNKATLRLGVVKASQNNFDEAGKHFTELAKSSTDWRDRTYASHWIQRLSRYKASKLAMLNCGSLALAHVLEKQGKLQEAGIVREMRPSSSSGYSIQDLEEIAAGYGFEFTGLRVSDNEMSQLPLPAIVHINARAQGDSGHYWILDKVGSDELEFFDPQAGRRFVQSYKEFGAQWDGIALVLRSRGITTGVGQMLTQAEQETFYGGCCGVPPPEDDLGEDDEDEDEDEEEEEEEDPCAEGAPTWSVNVLTMNLYMADIPLWYENPVGPGVRISISYNSQSAIAYHQPFGNKWQFNYGSYLVVDTGGQVTVFMPDGRRDVYSPNGAGGYSSELGKFNTLTKIAENHFVLKLQDDSSYEYDIPAGTTSLQPFLVKLKDRYGQALTFGYDSEVRFSTITDALGRVTTISYTNGMATTVTDPFGRSARFEYDANENLTKITDMGGYWTSLTYDENVYLTSVSNSRGSYRFYIEASDDSGANSDNYPPPGDQMWANYRITITNPLGGNEEYFYYGGCDYLEDFGCDGESWHVSPKYYVPWTSQTVNNYRSTAPKKRYFFTTVNGKGTVSNITYPDGGTHSYIPDETTLKRASRSDAHGHIKSYTYNAKGGTASVTDAKGKTTTLTYAPNDIDVTGVTNGLGTITLGYDGFHNVTSVTNMLGKGTRYTYNNFGQKTSEIDALDMATTYTYYDPSHPSRHLLKEISRDGKVLYSFTYDPVGRIQAKTDPAGLTLMFTYDNLNHIISVLYPDGKQKNFAYSDCCPWLIDSYTDRSGRTVYYTYDAMKRLTMVKAPDGTSVRYEYDADGNVAAFIDPNNGITRFEYDPMGRLTRKTYADGKYERFAYDSEGLPSAGANARDTISGKTTATYTYDENHRLTEVTYTDGTPNIYNFYDDYNRMIATGDGIGAWAYAYDPESRLLSVDGPWENDTVSYSYDDTGRKKSVGLYGSDTVEHVYDSLGRLSDIKPGGRTFRYVYPEGRPTTLPVRLTRPNEAFTTYQYDSINRLTEIANRNGSQQLIVSDAFTYDAQGMRGDETVTNGVPITNLSPNVTTYTYNRLNQLLSTQSPARSFTYDHDGNMTSGYTPHGYPFTATYDAGNRLKSIEYGDGGSGTHRTEYFYSASGMLARQVADGVETRFVRDALDVLQERDVANNVVRAYAWNPRAPGGIGGLLSLSQGGQRYSYLYDGKGNVSALIDDSQTPAVTYTYDEFGILMAKGGPLDQPYTFSTKPYDAPTGLSYYGYRFYAPALGRWMNRDPLGEAGGINLYGFVLNNPLNYIDPTGLFGTGGPGSPYPGHTDFPGQGRFDYDLEDQGDTSPYKQPDRHFRDLPQSEADVASAIANCDSNDFQRAMHRGQDYFSHYRNGYRWAPFQTWKSLGFGHLFAGHTPDQNVNAWNDARDWSEGQLNRWSENCDCRE